LGGKDGGTAAGVSVPVEAAEGRTVDELRGKGFDFIKKPKNSPNRLQQKMEKRG